MTMYSIIIVARYFSGQFIVYANSKAEAAKQVDQLGALWVCIEETHYID